MVQCQKTRFYLDEHHRYAGGIWRCPYCSEQEEYLRVQDQDLLDLVDAAIEAARSAFGVEDDGIPTIVWLGNMPETVYEERLGAYHLYLDRDSNWLQLQYSAAHEAFHRVCTPRNLRHWIHEMLAVMFALRYLRSIGLHEHAATNEAALEAEASQLSLARLLRLTATAYLPGVYGRAFVLGRELEAVVGWDQLRRLALSYDSSGGPDLEPWHSQLDPDQRHEVRVVLAVEASPT